jgi:hypothetical protein
VALRSPGHAAWRIAKPAARACLERRWALRKVRHRCATRIAELVRDGDSVAIEGFTHLISFAAGHEIIRQRKRDLTLARLTPDVIYDQMIAAGVARKLVFSWLGNPGVGGSTPSAGASRASSGRSPSRSRKQPLRHGRAVHRRCHEPAVLPAP